MDQPTVRKFRKKPVEIEAVLLSSVGEMKRALRWMEAHGAHGIVNDACEPPYLLVNTLEGTMEAAQGSYLIKGVQGEFYPCKADIFKSTYEHVE